MSSVPAYHEFKPLDWQYRAIYDMERVYDYRLGPQMVLLSGTVGSAKSVLLTFAVTHHAVTIPNTNICIGRLALPDLKKTLFSDVLEMMGGTFQEGRDFYANRTTAHISLANGTNIIPATWVDKRYKSKFRSLRLSMIAIEELVENDANYWGFFNEAIGRLGRVPHVKKNLFIAATNPDEPSHPAYEFWQNKCDQRFKKYWTNGRDRHVYYSSIKDNPYLPEFYEKALRDKYDEQMAQRMLDGKWLYIGKDKCYYAYRPDLHLSDEVKLDKSLELRLCFDFNIAKDKPMSSCLMQFDRRSNDTQPNNRRYKIIDEVCVEGMRTLNAMEAWAHKGYFDLPHNPKIIVHGDASGNHRQTSALRTDYEIIEHFLQNYDRRDNLKIRTSIDVQRKNPALRERHNTVNGNLKNADGKIRVAVHKKCKNVHEGFLSTRLKDVESYIEDPATKGQDMSSAISYGIWYCDKFEGVYDHAITMENV